MSTKLTGYVWDACASSGMKLSSVAIMARLADFRSDEGVSWPSIPTIARQIGAGESTVRTAISQLEKDGWLTRQQRHKAARCANRSGGRGGKILRFKPEDPKANDDSERDNFGDGN